jgi:hypothetical protein
MNADPGPGQTHSPYSEAPRIYRIQQLSDLDGRGETGGKSRPV